MRQAPWPSAPVWSQSLRGVTWCMEYWLVAPPTHHPHCTCSALGVWPRHCLADRLASLPGMKEKLEAGIKIADVGCGCA